MIAQYFCFQTGFWCCSLLKNREIAILHASELCYIECFDSGLLITTFLCPARWVRKQTHRGEIVFTTRYLSVVTSTMFDTYTWWHTIYQYPFVAFCEVSWWTGNLCTFHSRSWKKCLNTLYNCWHLFTAVPAVHISMTVYIALYRIVLPWLENIPNHSAAMALEYT